MNTNTPFLIKIGTDLIVGAIIRAGTSGDKTKQGARAQEVIVINAALTQLNNGDVTDGLASLEAATNTTALDPSEAAALVSAVGFISSKAAALQNLESGTAIGVVATQIAGQVLTEATTVAQAYVTAAIPPKTDTTTGATAAGASS
ncbi:MAG TPA: hypothetical protein VGG49_13310 [Steroidobacteraceae bacterium]|jgi:hypothetical protein